MYLPAMKWTVLPCICLCCWLTAAAQPAADPKYISTYELPYVARLSLERTGAGIEISPDNSLVLPTASFPFNTGTNLGLFVSYKFINLSVSQSLHSQTNNRAFAVAMNTYNGKNNFGGRLGFYNNVAAVQDKRNLRVRSSVNLVRFSPYWLVNTNAERFSLPAVTDYSQRQRRSAGAFMFELNPFFLHAGGKGGSIIPADNTYKAIFEDMAGLQKITIINLDFRPGYMYTKVFKEGTYFISGGLFLGPGFGYHHTVAETAGHASLHWQSSLRMAGSAGYNGDQFFVMGAFRYTNSFTPVAAMGVLASESTFMLTFGLRFDALENTLPKTWEELLGGKKR